jgi:hypothetical protein
MKEHKKSPIVICEICGKEVRKRGLAPHMRLLHHIKLQTITEVVENPTIKIEDLSNLSKKDLSNLSKKDLSKSVVHTVKTTVKYEHIKPKFGNPHAHISGDFLAMMDHHEKHGNGANSITFDQDSNVVPRSKGK